MGFEMFSYEHVIVAEIDKSPTLMPIGLLHKLLEKHRNRKSKKPGTVMVRDTNFYYEGVDDVFVPEIGVWDGEQLRELAGIETRESSGSSMLTIDGNEYGASDYQNSVVSHIHPKNAKPVVMEINSFNKMLSDSYEKIREELFSFAKEWDKKSSDEEIKSHTDEIAMNWIRDFEQYGQQKKSITTGKTTKVVKQEIKGQKQQARLPGMAPPMPRYQEVEVEVDAVNILPLLDIDPSLELSKEEVISFVDHFIAKGCKNIIEKFPRMLTLLSSAKDFIGNEMDKMANPILPPTILNYSPLTIVPLLYGLQGERLSEIAIQQSHIYLTIFGVDHGYNKKELVIGSHECKIRVGYPSVNHTGYELIF